MRTRMFLLFVALILAALMPKKAVAQSDASSQETQTLRKELEEMWVQMSKMQARLDQLESAKAGPSANQAAGTAPVPPAKQNGTIQTTQPLPQGPTSEQLGKATRQYQDFSEDNVAAPRYDNLPLDPKYHGLFYLPGTETILKIGGYAKTDFIYDLKPAGNTDSFVTSSIPVPQVASVNNFTVSIRPTRLNLDFRVPTTGLGEARFYVEADFFGTNSTTPRLRHAYGQIRNLLL